MAKLSLSCKCMVCKEPLQFPNNAGIVDVNILFLQFYVSHDKCEKLEKEYEQKLKEQLEVKQLAESMGVEQHADSPAQS